MTLEELKALNPSWENKVELECENTYYKIEVFSLSNTFYNYINCDGQADSDYITTLRHYSLKKPEPKTMRFYECITFLSEIAFLNKDGKYVNFHRKEVVRTEFDSFQRLNRYFDLNLETFEIVEWGEEK